MISITKLTLENFQSHKFTVLNFTEGLNSIIGPTDSGKTAIFRALKWVLYNQPSGDYFLRTGEDYVSVKVEFSNGYSIRRFRKKNKNGYEVTDPEGNKSEFFGFGVTIPEEVTNASMISKIKFTASDERYMNMAEQLDPPFLLAESTGFKAAAIGKLVGSDVIDAALNGAVNDLNSRKREKKYAEENLQRLETELSSYEYLNNLKESIDKLKLIQEKMTEKTNRLNILENYLIRFNNVRLSKSENQAAINSLAYIPKLEFMYEKLFEKNVRLSGMIKLDESLSIVVKRIMNLDDDLNVLHSINEILSIEKSLQNKTLNSDRLETISFNLDKVQKNKDIAEKVNTRLIGISRLTEIKIKLEELTIKQNQLINFNSKLTEHTTRINNGNKYMLKFQNLENIEDLNKKIESNRNVYIEYLKLSENLKSVGFKIKDILNKREQAIKEQEELTNSYRKLFLSMKICPTCFKPITEHDEVEVLKHIGV